MLTIINKDSSSLMEELSKLDVKYQDYFQTEGKWLVGGLKSILSIKPSEEVPGESLIMVRKEVFNMLPAIIKEDLSKFMDR